MDEQRLRAWTSVLEDRIKPEVVTLLLHRQVFVRVREIAQANPDLPPSYFIGLFQETYGNSQAVGVRRLVDRGSRPVSLVRLLSEIESMADQFTVKWFVGLWGADDKFEEHAARKSFGEHFGGKVGDHLDPDVISKDRERLIEVARPVVAHVDTTLAHMDKKPSDIPSFAEAHEAIEAISWTFRKYCLLLTATSMLLDNIPLDHDWERIFTVRWKEPPVDRWRKRQGLDR